MRTDRRTLLAAAGALVVTGGGARIVRAEGLRAAERPWSLAEEARSADPRLRAMAYAVLAPSAFNLQPWLAELPGDDTLVLRCDPACRLPQADAADRMTVVGFGNFLELLRMAAAQDGYRLEIVRFPHGDPVPTLDGRPIAVVRFRRGGAEPDALFAQVQKRRTSKRPYEPTAVPGGILDELRAVGVTGASLRASNDPDLVDRIRRLASQAFAIEKSTPRINLEQVRVTRIGEEEVEASPDGIDVRGPEIEAAVRRGELSRALLADPNSPASRRSSADYQALCDSARAYVWLSTRGDTRQDQLDAGCDWLRVHLKATELGLSFEPQSPALNQYPEMNGLFRAVHETGGTPPGHRLQMIGRLGYAAQMPPTARWPVEAKVLRT